MDELLKNPAIGISITCALLATLFFIGYKIEKISMMWSKFTLRLKW